jgi:hypothetical protein
LGDGLAATAIVGPLTVRILTGGEQLLHLGLCQHQSMLFEQIIECREQA